MADREQGLPLGHDAAHSKCPQYGTTALNLAATAAPCRETGIQNCLLTISQSTHAQQATAAPQSSELAAPAAPPTEYLQGKQDGAWP